MPFLEHDGVTRELPAGDTLVGSGTPADWRLLTINLAPRHFTVHIDDAGGAVLTPHRAQDVEVNGDLVAEPRKLVQGDEVIAGAGIFVFHERLENKDTLRPAPAVATTAEASPPSVEPAAAPALTPAASDRAYLIDIRAAAAYALGPDSVGIGRDPVNHVVVRDMSVSRFHGEVSPAADGSGFAFRSMGAGGSTVNGALVGGSPRVLAEGDLIRIGDTTLRYTIAPPPPAVRIVTKADVPAAPPSQQPTPIKRGSEPTTLGGKPPGKAPKIAGMAGSDGGSRSALIASAVVIAVLALVALFVHAVQR